MDRFFEESSKAARERLKATVERLSDADWDKSVGHGWTVKAALAHIAHWDNRRVGQLAEWERVGAKNVQFPQPDATVVNAAMLPSWLAMSPDEVKRNVIANAEAVDRKMQGLSEDLLQLLLDKQPGVPFRTRHRSEHLDEIDRALGS